MISKEVTILSKHGIHARPATLIAKAAAGSQVHLEKDGKKVSAGMMPMILSLGLRHNDTVNVVSDNDADAAAVDAVVAVLETIEE